MSVTDLAIRQHKFMATGGIRDSQTGQYSEQKEFRGNCPWHGLDCEAWHFLVMERVEAERENAKPVTSADPVPALDLKEALQELKNT